MSPGIDRLLTLEQAAEVLGTKPRFMRRLVAERRIRFIYVGRHIRISLNPRSRVHRCRNGPAGQRPLARRKGRA